MFKYRHLLTSSHQTPMIPFYPVVKKDLTFIDLGNSTYVDSGPLINFEKMRMVSKEIRNLIQMSSGSFDTRDIASFAAMNQLTSNKLTTTTGKAKHGGGGGGGGSNHHHKHTNLSPSKMYKEMNMIRKVKVSGGVVLGGLIYLE
jgi:Rap guanine nucleotide exchange factor 2